MPQLFSYVVEHDEGRSPNPFGRYCTLAHCKFSRNGRRKNIVESARVGDWIVGTGGANLRKSAGHGKMVYAMKVREKPTLRDYARDRRFKKREDNRRGFAHSADRFALVATEFYYFGREAIPIPKIFLNQPLEKKGPGFRSRFDDAFVTAFEQWIRRFPNGIHGSPCKPHDSHDALTRSC